MADQQGPGYEILTGPNQAKVNQVVNIVHAFQTQVTKELRRQALDLHRAGKLNKIADPTQENLLDLRRDLVQAVKEGMLERKDQEVKIGVLAALIWYTRLEEDRRFNVEHYGTD
jgi:hypothetical protein